MHLMQQKESAREPLFIKKIKSFIMMNNQNPYQQDQDYNNQSQGSAYKQRQLRFITHGSNNPKKNTQFDKNIQLQEHQKNKARNSAIENEKQKLYNDIENKRLNSMYERLQDKSYIKPNFNQKKIHTRWINALDSKFMPFFPQSFLLLTWNFLAMLAILFNFFEIPVALFLTEQVYASEMNTAEGLIINLAFLIILYIDTFVIRISISFYKKGKLVVSRLSIFYNYVKLQFWLNLISIVALTVYIVGHSSVLVYIKILFFARMYSLFEIDSQILHVLQFRRIPYALYRLARLIAMLWFLTSLAASIYFAIDYHYYLQKGQYFQQNRLWLLDTYAVGNLNLLQNFGWPVWYSYALYWALQTASTVGYGDITPMNPSQVLFVIIVILIMTILWAFYVNTIWKIIGQLQSNVVKYTDKWKRLIAYFRKSKLDQTIKLRLAKFLYNKWQDTQNYQVQEQFIKKQISISLRNQFYVEYRQTFFSGVAIFKAWSCQAMDIKQAMKDLVYCVQQITFCQKDNVYEEGENDPYLYYLKKGDVILTIKGSILKQKIKPNTNFGHQGFFRKRARNHTATAQTFCKIWRLKYQNLRNTIKNYPFLNQQFHQIQYRIILQNSPLFLGINCWKCKSKFHFMNQCPQINSWQDKLSTNRTNIIRLRSRQFYVNYNQVRQPYARTRKNNFKKIGYSLKLNLLSNSDFEEVRRFSYYFPQHNIIK